MAIIKISKASEDGIITPEAQKKLDEYLAAQQAETKFVANATAALLQGKTVDRTGAEQLWDAIDRVTGLDTSAANAAYRVVVAEHRNS